MKKRIGGIVTLLLMVMAASVLVVHAQQVTAKIPFEFRSGKKTLPAGTYDITYNKSAPNVLNLRNQSGGAITEVPVITRLAAKDQPGLGAHMVFDEVETAHSLAEFWLPGVDGFYLGGETALHTHVTINATK
jgi:hypothetical protein